MVCRDFILPEPASYVLFYVVSNLRKLLYIIYFVASRLSHVQLAKMLVRGVGAQASRYICGSAAIHHLLLKTAGGFVSPSTNIGPRSRY